jgi:predicted membrane-bound mannosyltransferase
VLAWIALVALALALRLIDLGDRPFHHDESQDAYFSWIFRDAATTSTCRSCTARCAST